MTDENPTVHESIGVRGAAGVILLILALVVGMVLVLLLPYLPALVEWALVGEEV
ncbi:hypothetical protein ABZ479_09625 [Streptomyces sp. NPDC005722]